MKPKHKVVHHRGNWAVAVDENDLVVIVKPNGDCTHYIPGSDGDEELTLGHASGMASTIRVFGESVELLINKAMDEEE